MKKWYVVLKFLSYFIFIFNAIIQDITCQYRKSSNKFRIGFIKPNNGEGLGFSFADFRDKIVVISVKENSPAGNSGMVSVGNIILSVQGQDVSKMNSLSLAAVIQSFKPGERIIFHIEKHSLSSFSKPETQVELLEGEFVTVLKKGNRGYGIQMERRKSDKQIVVQKIIEGSSAYLSKSILPGDIIMKVNGKDTSTRSFRDVKNDFTKSQKIRLQLKSITGLKRVFRFKSTIVKPKGSLGIRLKRDYEKSIYNISIFIENLIEHSHADIASRNSISTNGSPDATLFRPNDRILAINGKDMKDFDMGETVKALKSIQVGKLIVFELIRIIYLPKRAVRKKSTTSGNTEQKQKQQRRQNQQQQQQQQQEEQNQYVLYKAQIQKTRQIGLGIRVTNTRYGVVIEDVITVLRNDIQPGDTIVSINGVSLKGMSFNDVIHMLRSVKVNTRVELMLERQSSSKRRSGRAYRNTRPRQGTRRPDVADCSLVGPEALKRKIGVLGVGEMKCAPAKFGPPLPRNPIQSTLIVPKPYHGCSKLIDKYTGKILLMPRGKCFFHEKAIHAQRAGAVGVVISNSREDGGDVIFEMELPQTPGMYSTEPVTIPLVMISQQIGLAITRFSGSAKVFSMKGIYDAGKFGGDSNRNKYGKKKKTTVTEASPVDVHDNPAEILFDFSSGTLELNLGRPGKVGNPGPTGRTIHLERSITLQDIYVGGKIKIKFDRHRLCPQCHGRGGIEGGLKPCPHCAHTHDVGRHVVSDLLGNTFSQKNEKTCSICKGHGEVLKTPNARCPTCNGHGVVKEEEEVVVRYPIGMHDGYVKIFSKLGIQPRYGTAGDVVVKLTTMVPHGFQRAGADLMTAVEVSFSEALLGFNRTVFLPNGESFHIEKTGVTRPGTTITKYGYGLPYEQELKKNKRRSKKKKEAGRIEGGYGKPQNDNSNKNENESDGNKKKYDDNNEIPRGNVNVRVIIDFNNLSGLQQYSKERVRAAFNENDGNNDNNNDDDAPTNSFNNPTNGSAYFNNTNLKFGNIFKNAFRL